MKKFLFIFLLIFFIFPSFVLAEQININSATLSQLDEIAHVGTKTAQKIIDNRPYSSLQDLSKIKGIGNGKYLQDIINQGFACINCTTEIAQTQNTDNLNKSLVETTSPTATPIAPEIIYPNGVYINEILPNPSGSDETDEWIELYNSNNFDVDLFNWKIKDSVGTISTFTIPQNTKITTLGFLVFKRPETKIMLNNDEDGLSLSSPDNKIVDTISFTKAPLNQSYNRISSGWAWSTTLTPGAKNIGTIPEIKNKTLSKTKNSAKNDIIAEGLADISQSDSASNPWFLFFIVLATTIILSIIILFIKLRLGKGKNNAPH